MNSAIYRDIGNYSTTNTTNAVFIQKQTKKQNKTNITNC